LWLTSLHRRLAKPNNSTHLSSSSAAGILVPPHFLANSRFQVVVMA